jgi:hypothetical protein
MTDEAKAARRIHRPRASRMATILFILAVAYLAIAYLLLPMLWRHYENQPALADKPMLTRTAQGIPGDPINVGLVGSREEVVRTFVAAGWHPADPITLRTSVAIGLSVVLDRPDLNAPVSSLFYEGRKQDLAFELPDGRSADKRNHVRFWLTLDKGREGRPVWLGAASFDRGVGLSHRTGQITHHVGPDLDHERDFLMGTLEKADVVERTYQISGIGPTLRGWNGGGDPYFTDGEVTVAVLKPAAALPQPLPGLEADPPRLSLMHRVWQALIGPLLRHEARWEASDDDRPAAAP